MFPVRVVFAALLAISVVTLAIINSAGSEGALLNTMNDVFQRVGKCFKPPSLPPDDPGMQITVHFMLKRNGELLGRPMITYESPDASEDDRLAYRVAVMNALQTCTPMPLSDGLGNAIAGKPFRLLLDDRRNLKRTERQQWLTTTTL